MISIRKVFLTTIILLLVLVILTNYYFMVVLYRSENEVRNLEQVTIEEKILQKVPFIAQDYKKKRSFNKNDPIASTFVRNLKNIAIFKNKSNLWKEVRSWVSNTQLYNYSSPYLGSVLHALKTAKIIKADIDVRGTQLKLLLTLEGNQNVVFKPQWYPIEKVIEGPVYAGKDRYFSEIVAFYLSGILGKPLTPVTVERKISLKNEIIPVATDRLKETIFEHKSLTCVYGKCFYCKKEDPVCSDANGIITGAIIFNVDANLKTSRSPWQRTYKKGKKALWETNDDYCKIVKSKLSSRRLLSLVDTSIFDFLIQNGDRHHYEALEDNVILIDNGKGFGNPYVNHIDILAPLYQCCMLRSNTWERLKLLSGGLLKEELKTIPDIQKIITDKHLDAIDQRLLIVYAAIDYCGSRNKIEHSVL